MKEFLQNKKVLITGACGTVGSELIHFLSDESNFNLSELIGIDNNERALFFIDQKYESDSRIRFYLADVRDSSKINRMMKGIDIVFHAAALKHVVLCKKSPFESVQTNIHGVQNIIQAAIDCKVKTVVFTSSDKAVNPTNVMGTSKLMGERLMTAANNSSFSGKTIFSSTRFGNVLGSNGSVTQIFNKQIKEGGPVTLTDQKMTRFVMSITDAARLVIDSSVIAQGGEVFVTKMPVIKIADLARVMIDEMAPVYGYDLGQIEISEIGSKPGEKIYEELMSHEEMNRSVELKDFFAILPALRTLYHDTPYDYNNIVSSKVTNPYVSSKEPAMSHDMIRKYLYSNILFNNA